MKAQVRERLAAIDKRVEPVRSDPTPESYQYATERHYTKSQLAEMWSLSEDTINRMFAGEPVLKSSPNGKARIPESIVRRVHARFSGVAEG